MPARKVQRFDWSASAAPGRSALEVALIVSKGVKLAKGEEGVTGVKLNEVS